VLKSEECLISLTSVPRRFHRSLPQVIDGLLQQRSNHTVLVNIPHTYRKWGPAAAPEHVEGRNGVILYRPSKDFGPATKLLGALEFIRDKPHVKYIVTVDDDVYPAARGHISYLLRCAAAQPGAAVTIGGILLDREPYRFQDGLLHREKMRLVHAPAGYRGVVYPADRLRNSRTPFELVENLPEGTFHDDDAYFGCVLGAMGIPLVSVPGRPRLRFGDGAHESAVAEKADQPRIENEMAVFQAGVDKGFLTVPIPQPKLPLRSRIVIRWAYLRFRIGGMFGRIPRPVPCRGDGSSRHASTTSSSC